MVSKVPKVLEFFDVKTKKKFKTSNFKIVFIKTKKGGRRKAAVAISPAGTKSFRFLPK